MYRSTQIRRRLTAATAALFTTLALAATAAPAHADTPGAPATGPVASAALTADQASAQARATGKAVPVDIATTATNQLTANTDGTFTLNQALAPVRKRQNGAWKPLDNTLLKRSDGTIAPALTTSDLTLSAGGNGPLATMKSGTRSLSLTLPASLLASLPAPTLSGPTATYSLLDGVDLQLTADLQGGFSEVLVVKNAAAAANPALASLAFTTQTSGLDLGTDAGGNITAKDPHGALVFSAPAPTRGMWDSATNSAAPTVTNPAGTLLDARTGAPAASSANGPGAAAHVAAIKDTYSPGTITLTPDPALLSGTNTVWPLYIDPSYSAGGGQIQAWTYVNSYYNTTSYWNTTDSEGLRVGDQAWVSPNFLSRAYAQVSVSPQIYGANVISSTFYATETWSPSCTASDVELWGTYGINQSTTWNNQPGWNFKAATRTVAYGYSSSCPSASVGWDTTALMQNGANSAWPSVTLGLKASNEGDPNGFKRFQPSSMSMSTTYDHAPNTPGPLTTSPATSCGANPPTVIGNGDVTLYAGVSDPDGGNLGVAFSLVNSGTGQQIASSDTSSLQATSGTTTALFVPRSTLVGNANGALTTYQWNVWTTDGRLNSPTSAMCKFTFDPTHPGAPSITQQATSYTVGTAAGFTIAPNATGSTPASYLYQLNGANPQSVSATNGNATVTIKPTRRVNVLTLTAVSPGGNIGDTANLTLNAAAPATAVEHDMTGAGRPDLVVVGNQLGLPPGLWLSSGITASSVNAAANDIGALGTGAGGSGSPTDWNGTQAIVGHFASGAGFNDVLDYNPANGTGQILFGAGDGSTLQPTAGNHVGILANSFQSPTNPAHFATQVANGGNLYAAANSLAPSIPDLLIIADGILYDDPAFGTPGVYGGTTYDLPLSATNPTGTGDWTGWTITSALVNGMPALFARNDAGNGLYYYNPTTLLNLATGSGSTTPQLISSTWDSSTKSPLIQAADINGDGTPDLWTVSPTGAITTDLMTGSGVSTNTGAAQSAFAPTHTWPLNDSSTDGATVTTAADTTGGTSALPLAGQTGATWSTKDLFNPDVRLNATTMSTSGPALSTSASFTVSVWAKPNATGGVVATQDGTQTAGFTIYPDTTTNQWYFCMATADTTGWPYDCAHGGGGIRLGIWTHLTATYNATTGVMALYTNGIDIATMTHTPVAGFNGNFATGSYLNNGVRQSYYNGTVSNIQVWAGTALTPTQVAYLSGTPGYYLFPSDGTNYPSGSTWATARGTMTFANGTLTVTETGSGSSTWSQGGAGNSNSVLTLQSDGNLVIYPQAAHTFNTALWGSGTNGDTNDVMFFQPDGNLIIYRNDGVGLWSTGTYN
ncbi:hypothetical protein [Kitasatospora viridis]|uniref:D-mannose binding lectin n=1 Tax=Kitasatospora viridis TaxID=281105 RepID=A0A561SF11_9ACTN|nr:hypothetical protein [Kitasatospora viridis]TWF73442.1 D-mannose binding lectin [Kitasatospora viridis]